MERGSVLWVGFMLLVSSVRSLALECTLPIPVSTNPTSPNTVSNGVPGAFGGSFNLTIWRHRCANGRYQLMLTMVPTGSIMVSSMSYRIVQNNRNFSAVLWGERLGTLRTVDLESINAPKTYLMDAAPLTLGTSFDASAPFQLQYLESSPARTISVGSATASGGSTPALRVFSGALSGTWWVPSRGGQGYTVEIAQTGSRTVVFIAWFTYSSGRQMWLTGNVDISASTTIAEIPLFETAGGEIGPTHNPASVTQMPRGRATIRFPGCNSMQLTYVPQGQSTGVTYDAVRLVGNLAGVSCN